ncbi:hypothetical protein [Streptomyces sp. NPDC057623]
MIASLLASFAIAAVIVAWTFLATVRWARFGTDQPTPPRRTPTWARRNR